MDHDFLNYLLAYGGKPPTTTGRATFLLLALLGAYMAAVFYTAPWSW